MCIRDRYYDLRVTFCPKRSTFKQRLLVPHTLGINIGPGLNVIDCIQDNIDALPKMIIKVIFTLLVYSDLQRFGFDIFVDLANNLAGGHCFAFADVVAVEKELAV